MKNRFVCIGFIVLILISISACSAVELEENTFPLAVLVGEENEKVMYGLSLQVAPGKGNTFAESKTEYESHLNKNTDYNHLKVLVMEEEVLEKQYIYIDMLDYLAQTETYPRNTYVCVVDDVDDMLELEKRLSQDIGTYLEEYLKSHESKKAKLLTLGDLLNEKENQTMIQYLPYLEVEENYVKWTGYVNTLGKIWKESQ